MSDGNSTIDVDESATETPTDPHVTVEGLSTHFDTTKGLLGGLQIDFDQFPPIRYEGNTVEAVDDVSFEIRRGETLGLVGESGCGKSTLGRTLLGLHEPTAGSITIDGTELNTLDASELRRKRSDMQLVFQDPFASMNPRLSVGRIIEEPLQAHGMTDADRREARAKELLEMVGLHSPYYDRYPHEFSGGQRQRINLARALSVDPSFVVCDEPVSALDVSVQAQILNTMADLQDRLDLTYLFIAHDLSVIRQIADRVAVMYLGRIVELAETTELFENPSHPYTRALLASVPVPDPRHEPDRRVLEGEMPSPTNPPSGCRFRTRCPELIAPEEYALTDEEWDQTLRFVRAVDRRTVEPQSRAALETTFFPDGLPNGAAGKVLDDALDLISLPSALADQRSHSDSIDNHHEDQWDRAKTLVTNAFTESSICANARPEYTVDPKHGSEPHDVACHLYR